MTCDRDLIGDTRDDSDKWSRGELTVTIWGVSVTCRSDTWQRRRLSATSVTTGRWRRWRAITDNRGWQWLKTTTADDRDGWPRRVIATTTAPHPTRVTPPPTRRRRPLTFTSIAPRTPTPPEGSSLVSPAGPDTNVAVIPLHTHAAPSLLPSAALHACLSTPNASQYPYRLRYKRRQSEATDQCGHGARLPPRPAPSASFFIAGRSVCPRAVPVDGRTHRAGTGRRRKSHRRQGAANREGTCRVQDTISREIKLIRNKIIVFNYTYNSLYRLRGTCNALVLFSHRRSLCVT